MSVILSTGAGCVSQHARGQGGLSQHALGNMGVMDRGAVDREGVCVDRGDLNGGVDGGVHPPPPETATKVGGTHPTGMHSC